MMLYEVHEIAKLPSGGIHIKSHGVFSLLDDADSFIANACPNRGPFTQHTWMHMSYGDEWTITKRLNQ